MSHLNRSIAAAVLGCSVSLSTLAGDDLLKPYTLASMAPGGFDARLDQTRKSLQVNGFEVVGEYSPYPKAHILIVTSPQLKQIAAQSENGGFAAAQRVSITEVEGQVQVAYTNPVYMAHAYRLKDMLDGVSKSLEGTLGKVEDFGAKGVSPKKLGKYHYTFGMEYFTDTYELAEYDSHAEALEQVEQHLIENDAGVSKVYRVDIPGKEEVVFGVSMKGEGEQEKYKDDTFQMSIVDFSTLKQTAYLPYEVMVSGNKVIALHMRFRMAVNFPDLKMVGHNSFATLMPSPNAIEQALIVAVGGDPNDI
jgi:hypothetical protein